MRAETSGWSDAQGRLKLIRDTVRDQITTQAVRAGGLVILEEMVSAAPVLPEKSPRSTAWAPGALKASLRERVRAARSGLAVAIVGPFNAAPLANWVEYGHRLVKGGQLPWSGFHHKTGEFYRRGGSGRQIGDVPAHPFLRPAFEAKREAAMAKMAEVFTDGIRRLTDGR